VRAIAKGAPPATVTETKAASTTDLSMPRRARTAFDQIDKAVVRAALAREQCWLCAFCMRRVDDQAADERGPTMKIAHRTPVAVDASQALTWKNLLGSCDGGQRSGGGSSCDLAQENSAISVDPTETTHVARLTYERREAARGLFVTSTDPAHQDDLETALNLNGGDLPALRDAARRAFQEDARRTFPKGPWGKRAWLAHFPEWKGRRGSKLPEMLGVIQALIR